MRTHLPSHHLIYFCFVCSASFPSSLRLAAHLVVHQNESSSSPADLFWQSVSKSVFLPRSNDVSFMDSSSDVACVGQMNSDPSNGLEDVLRDVECTPMPVFPHCGVEMLASIGNSRQECEREVAECEEQRYDERNDVNASPSLFNDIPCIDQNVCLKMGFKPMSRHVFSRLRQAYGCNECEYCGKLFFAQSDLDTHVNVHAGLFFLEFLFIIVIILQQACEVLMF